MTSASQHDAETFDYVVIGAGAAGAIVAARLAERADVTVCLLEAGPPDRHPYLHLPAGFIKMLFNPRYTWPFATEASEHTHGRRIPIPQGRTLGGSTSINGLVYNRGQREDYDGWAALGNPGWAYDDVLPYFKRSERRIGATADDAAWRGQDGPLPVSDLAWRHPLCEAFIAGAQAQGIPLNPDYNGASQEGVGYFQRTIHDGWRMSTARTFLRGARQRANLAIRTHAQATELMLEGKRVVGVRYCHAGDRLRPREVRARREVIVSCGPINTAKLLQLSGIGPGSLLQQRGIPVRHALNGIGENLSDHFSVRCVARVHDVVTINELARLPRLIGQAWRWLRGQPNILAVSPSLVHVFWKSDEALERADLQGVFAPASYREGYVGMLDRYPGMTCGFWQHRPWSTGHVRIRSRDPFEAPEIQPNYLADERDRAVLIAGVKLARRLLRSAPLAPYVTNESLPGKHVESDADLLDFIHRYGVSSYHLNGTARMGPADDPQAVVDAELCVIGLKGLRIADASVMPRIPSANICAATMMIGEKAADLIRRTG